MPLSLSGIDEQRRAQRRSGNHLQADRVILQQARNRRETLLTEFDSWLAEHWKTTLEELLFGASFSCENVCEALVSYGKDMYNAGKSYGRFSETINAITARRSVLRKQVAAAWDLAFNWVVDEPHEHHRAMPLSIMIATITLAMMWGWLREAAIIAMTWTGVLRVGESLAALRSDLVLPEDAAPGTTSALVKIRLPKTRGRAARHQSSKVDPVDIVLLLKIAFRATLALLTVYAAAKICGPSCITWPDRSKWGQPFDQVFDDKHNAQEALEECKATDHSDKVAKLRLAIKEAPPSILPPVALKLPGQIPFEKDEIWV
eukprot:s568_g5.t1